MIRKFKLKKGATEYDLNDRNHYLDEPQGLGFAIASDTLRAGETFVITDSRQNQKQITGNIIFPNYTEYTNFISFIGDNKGIKFNYSVDQTTHEVPVIVSQLEKSQITTGKYLSCAITFTALSTWYTNLVYALGDSPVVTSNDEQLQTTSNQNIVAENTATTLTIQNGNLVSPMKITISGPIAQGTITWTLSNGTSGAWTGALANNASLVINSDPDEMEIAKYVGTTRTNEYPNADFTKERFLYAPAGTSTLSFSSNVNSASVEVKKYELSV